MRKFKRFPPRTLRFRPILILAGAFALLVAFTPCTNAQGLLRYYNFEGTPTSPYPVNLDSHAPASQVGGGPFGLALQNTTNGPYPFGNTSHNVGLPQNIAMGDPGPNLASLGIHHSSTTQLNMVMNFVSAQGIYNITSVSFAVAANGNGYSSAAVQMSTNGGISYTTISAAQAIPEGALTVLTFNIAPGTTLGIPLLFLRINFTGGQSNGEDLQNQIDNIQVNGIAVPEPTTIAGGLLGVLGLCWHQRRRLIRCVRLRCA